MQTILTPFNSLRAQYGDRWHSNLFVWSSTSGPHFRWSDSDTETELVCLLKSWFFQRSFFHSNFHSPLTLRYGLSGSRESVEWVQNTCTQNECLGTTSAGRESRDIQMTFQSAKRFAKSFAKRSFCGLKRHLNIATQGAWQSGLQSRGRYSFSIWIKELKEIGQNVILFLLL